MLSTYVCFLTWLSQCYSVGTFLSISHLRTLRFREVLNNLFHSCKVRGIQSLDCNPGMKTFPKTLKFDPKPGFSGQQEWVISRGHLEQDFPWASYPLEVRLTTRWTLAIFLLFEEYSGQPDTAAWAVAISSLHTLLPNLWPFSLLHSSKVSNLTSPPDISATETTADLPTSNW